MLRFHGLVGRSGVLHNDAGWHTLAVQEHAPLVRAQAHGTPTCIAMLSHDIDRSFCLFIALLLSSRTKQPVSFLKHEIARFRLLYFKF